MKNKKVGMSRGFTALEFVVVGLVLAALFGISITIARAWKKGNFADKNLKSNTFVRETADERMHMTEQQNRDGSWKLTAYLIGPDTSVQIIGTDHDWSEADKVNGVPVPTFDSLSLTIGRSDEVFLIEKQVEYGPHGIPRTKTLATDSISNMTDDDSVEVEPPVDAFDILEEYEKRLTEAVAQTYRKEFLQEK